MQQKYHYTIRPADDAGDMLIEFKDLPEGKEFIKQLIGALEPVNIEVVNYDDLWMNDEIALKAASDIGSFYIYRDAKDRYFITASGNYTVLSLIDNILSRNKLYERI